MAASDTTPNTLKINITADATAAKSALAEIGKAATETKAKIDDLQKGFSSSTKKISDLTKDVATLQNTLNQNFTFKGVEKSLGVITARLDVISNKLGTAASGLISGLNKAKKQIDVISAKVEKPLTMSVILDKGFKGAEAELDRLRKKYAEPVTIFTVTDTNVKRLEGLFKSLDADRAKHERIVNKEIELLREQRLNYRAASDAAKVAGTAHQGMAKLYKGILTAQEKLVASSDINRVIRATNGTSRNRAVQGAGTVVVPAQERRSNKREPRIGVGVHGGTYFSGGLGAFAAAFGLRSVYDNISTYQQKQARVSAWGLTPEEKAQWDIQRRQLMKNNPLISNAESESMMMAAASSLGHYNPEKVGATVGAATKYAQLEKVMGYNKSEVDDIVKNYYGVAEARQVTNDVQKVLDTFKTVFNITTTTAGKISVADIETIMRNMGPGAATISDEGLLRLLAYAEQIKVAGKGSSGSTGAGISTVGTNVKMLQLMAMGKPSSINAKKSLAQLGIMDDDIYSIYDKKIEGDGSEGSKDAQQLARLVFTRGDQGQILDKGVFVKGNLANAGAYKKDLAQTDPVAWVTEIGKLIESFVVKEENRAIYFGDKGRESQQKHESDEDFHKKLSDADIISAQTTFWSKTGLSQRVLTALSTFSNVNFQIRSEEMMHTAKSQKSADDLMKEQIEMGNLSLATEMLKKSIIRLTESFEPMTSWIGKAAIAVSEMIDKVAEWVNSYQTLAGVTAGWLAIKSLISSLKALGVTFDDVALKELKVANAARQMERAQTAASLASTAANTAATAASNGAMAGGKAQQPQPAAMLKQSAVANIPFLGGFNRALNSSYTAVVGWGDKVKEVIGTIGVAFSKCVTLFGVAWLAIDVASIFAGWLVEFTQFGKDCKKIWEQVVESINTSNIVLTAKMDDQKYRTPEQNKELERINKRIAELKERNADTNPVYQASFGDDEYNAQDYSAQIAAYKELKELEARSKEIIQQQVDLMKTAHTLGSSMAETFKETGLTDAIREQVQATSKVENIAGAINGSGIAQDDSDEAKQEFSDQLKTAREEEIVAIEKVSDLITSPKLVEAFSSIEKVAKGIKNVNLREAFLAEYYEKWGKDLANDLGLANSKLIKAIIDKMIESVRGRAQGNIDVSGMKTTEASLAAGTSVGNTEVQKAQNVVTTEKDKKEAAKKQEEQAKKDGKKLPQGTEIGKEKKTSVVDRWFTNNQKTINRYRSKMMDSGDIESWAETRERMKEELKGEILSGKFDKNGQRGTFLKKDYEQKKTEDRTEEDIDWTNKFYGKTAVDVLNAKVYAERLKMFQNAFGSMFKNATKNLEEAKQKTEDAKTAMDDLAGYYADSADIREFDKQTAKYLSDMKANGTASAEQLQSFAANRAGQRAEMAKQHLYTQAKSDKDTAENSKVSHMTSKEQLTYNYNKQKAIADAQHEQIVRQIKSSAIDPSEQYRLLQEAETQYLAASEARYKDYYDQLTNYSNDYLHQKMEDWQDLGSYMKSMQDTIMDGFISANEKWLDGDKDSWRDYFNDILKMWRNMALKMGMSKLLGGITEGITGVIKDGVAGIFGKEKPKGAGSTYNFTKSIWDWLNNNKKEETEEEKTANMTVAEFQKYQDDKKASSQTKTTTSAAELNPTQQVELKLPTELASNLNGLSSNTMVTANSLWGTGFNSQTWLNPQNSADQSMANGVASSLTSGYGFSNGLGQFNSNIGNTWSSQNLGMGNTTSSLLTSGSLMTGAGGGEESQAADKASSSLTEMANQTAAATSGMGTLLTSTAALGEAFGLNESTTQGLNTAGQLLNITTTAYNATQQILNALGLTQTTNQGNAVITMATFNLGLQMCVEALAEFWAMLQASKWSATASANGNIMTSHGPLKLNKYANGGIAKEAQISIFGEGRTPEAYVPLPDGRTIPVTMNVDGLNGETDSAGGNQIAISINITNNNGNSTETESSEGSTDNAEDMRTLANNIKAAVKNEIYNQSRPGGMLYNPR